MSNPQETYTSGGANNTTGREPFGDSTSTGYGNTGNTGATSGLTGTSTTGTGGVGHHLTDNTRGDIKAGTSADPAVGHGRNTGDELLNSGIRRQTGDEYGGIQTGSTATGTGHNISDSNKPSIGEKIKDALTPGDSNRTGDHSHTSTTHSHTGNTGSGLTGSHSHGTDSGLTGSNTHSGVGSGLTGSHSHSQHEGHHHHGTGTGTGLSSGGIGATGTLGAGTSTATKEAPYGTHKFEHDPIDKTTGEVHHFTTTTTTGTGSGLTGSSTTGSGLTHGTGLGHEHGHSHGHHDNSHYGSNTAAGDYDKNTSGLTGSHSHGTSGTGLTGSSGSGLTGSHSGTGLTGSHSGSGLTGSHSGTGTGLTGNSGVASHQGREGAGPVSGGAAGTDRFDVDRESSGAAGYGHNVDDKRSNDHTLGSRHGNDFTGGDTKDAAYHNPGRTGLTGRESTTTGVQDQNLDGTGGAHKEGLLEKVKNVFTHSNTNAADDSTASKTTTGHGV